MLFICPHPHAGKRFQQLAKGELCLSVNVPVTYSQINMEIKVHEG